MVYIETDNENKVVYQHFFPEELSDEDKQDGFLIESVPELTQKNGYMAILNYTKERGFWTSYEDMPKSNENAMQNRIDELEKSVMELTLKLNKVGA